jgi:DNA invertase Pin-like site-specific DNA recombinase
VKVALYARVSAEGQDPEGQLIALRALTVQRGWQVVEEFVDRGVSGGKERRPALDRLMKAAWAGHSRSSSSGALIASPGRSSTWSRPWTQSAC